MRDLGIILVGEDSARNRRKDKRDGTRGKDGREEHAAGLFEGSYLIFHNFAFYSIEKNQGVIADEPFDTIFSRTRDTGIGGTF